MVRNSDELQITVKLMKHQKMWYLPFGFRGRQAGHGIFLQFIQWEITCREEAQRRSTVQWYAPNVSHFAYKFQVWYKQYDYPDVPQTQTIDITVSMIKHVDTDFEVEWRFWQLLLSISLFWWEEQELPVQKCCAIFASVYEAHLESKKRFKAKFSLEILISLHTWSGEGLLSNYAHLDSLVKLLLYKVK